MIVCLCKAVSDREIRSAIGEGHTTVKALARSCGAGTGDGCGGCHGALKSMLQQHCHAHAQNAHAHAQHHPHTHATLKRSLPICRAEDSKFALASGDSNS